jgi:glycosyltransferase involved in cell wall biosynthesis
MNRSETTWTSLPALASAEETIAALRACISPASFWTPERLGPQVSWLEHAPFAFWLVEALRPRMLVEVGTHGGFSYFTFCEAVRRCGIDSRCFAVDAWNGDEHAGSYGEDVFRDVASHNQRCYSAFSTLVRSTFDEAAGHFSDGTIDLLHIDGRHFYDDVKHDFDIWQPKLSGRAVVLFHDINVRERGFGVFRVWEELRLSYPHFEFHHGHGLGVLGVGTSLPSSVRELFVTADEPEAAAHIRNAYAQLGSAISLALQERELSLKLDRLGSEVGRARLATDSVRRELAAVTAQKDELLGELARLTAGVTQERTAANATRQTLEAQSAELHEGLSRLTEERMLVANLEALLAAGSAREACREVELVGAEKQIANLEAKAAERSSDMARLNVELVGAHDRAADLEAKLAKKAAEAVHNDAELIRTRAHAAGLGRQLEMSQRQLQWTLASTSWQLTRPLRRLGTAWPKLAKHGRRLINSLGLGRALRPDRPEQVAAPGQSRTPGALLDRVRIGSRLAPEGAVERSAADCRLLAASGLFDANAYRGAAGIDATVDAVEHYVTTGWRQGIEPWPGFESAFLEPYYRSAGFAGSPALTYLKLRAAGWPVFATRADAESVAAPIRASELFDSAKYCAALGGLPELDPALYYVLVGERTGLAPSDRFDPDYYADRYPDLGREAVHLHHYLTNGRLEGRRPLPVAATLAFDRTRLKKNRETVLLVVHEASRTGAPILAYNVAKRLRRSHNVVAILLASGGLIEDFEACCAATIGPLTYADWHPGEIKHLIKHVLAAYPVSYAIVNSIASWMTVPPLGRAMVPVVLLVHEFASYTRPKSAMAQGLHWATEIVFSADLVARSAREEHPTETRRGIHVFPQGRCDLPLAPEPGPRLEPLPDLPRIFRPPGTENALVVLGCGFVHIRKGVDLFLSCAAAVATMQPRRPVRFIWIGHGYAPEEDANYSCYLADQIVRSGLERTVAIIDEIPDLEPAYAMSDVFFLSSRLDPLPNVTIDAAVHGIPVVCFEGATGMADILAADPGTRQCVVPHLDVHSAAAVIVDLANDEAKRRQIGEAFRKTGQATFDMDRYVARVAALGNKAKRAMRQRAGDIATLGDDPMFDPVMYLPFDATPLARDEAIVDFVARWAVVGTTPASRDYFFRRPCAGFHPQIYAHAHADNYNVNAINPLAHFIRSGKLEGPWRHDVITPASRLSMPAERDLPPTALHAHFHYPELAEDFFRKLAGNATRCDLLLSTDESGKAKILRNAASQYRHGDVDIRVVPNRGRDIGAFLTAFGEEITKRYEIVGHLHGKRSVFARGSSDPYLGDRWREFLWQNLLGDSNPMMDIVVENMLADERLGLVFPDNPQLPCWDGNRDIAEELARRMAIIEPLPPFFEFPVGTMFWARTAAIKPLFDLALGWDDYPEEPIATDGTILHALERLLPFVARHAGYRFAGTHIPGLTW